MRECLFCAIAEDSKNLVWENEQFAAFRDLHPKAKTHLLVIPKEHIDTLDDLEHDHIASGLIRAVREVASSNGLKGRYRVQINVGRLGGQEIDHLHVHLLAD
ncbi:MAG TPA: HIT domain-containing protein [Candidatus Dormibacteraeota bacterium]|nr:HIT domain-containing protein [Candidatus Dormibacteraeota bacterium]